MNDTPRAGAGPTEAVTLQVPPDAEPADPRAWRVPAAGTLIARRYRVVRLLGHGGMGAVVEAEHLELGVHVALKLLDPGYSHDPGYAERFRREARTASRLHHRNVARVLDLGQAEDGRLYYAMELVRGRHLGAIIDEVGAMDPARAVHIVLQICDALTMAHAMGVVHRDLKPENVLIEDGPEGGDRVRLVDFGIALYLDSPGARLTQTGGVLGTPQYMAPEQVARRPADARTDVYAAGVLLYELLTGTPPFHEGVPVEMMAAHLNQRPEPPRERAPGQPISELLEGVVLRALEKRPDDRQQSMEDLSLELWAAIEAAEAPRPAAAPRAAPGGRKPAPSRDTVPDEATPAGGRAGGSAATVKVFVAAAAAVVVAGVAVGVVVGLLGRGGPPESQPPTAVAARAPSEPVPLPAGPAAGAADGGALAAASTADAGARASGGQDAASSTLEWDGPPDQPGPRRPAGAGPTAPAAPAPSAGARSTAELLADAQSRLRQGDAASAAPRFRQVLARAPGTAAAHAGLGQAEFQLGHDAAAAEHFRRAVALGPTNVRYRILYAGVLTRLGRSAEAREQYAEVLRLDPDNAVARRMMARVGGR